ncbi:MAG: hypothetical protein K2I70_01405, partial [Bacilli bacterium]|nr:hypothetical protein [Bacilli bacterium]
VNTVQEELNFIREDKIEEIVEEEYIRNLKQVMRKQITKLSSMLDEATMSIIRLSENKNEVELDSLFHMLTNELVRKQNPQILDAINENFTNEMRSSILRNRQLETIIGENRLYDVASDIKYHTRRVIERYSEELMYNFQDILSNQLEQYRNQVIESIKEQQLKDAAKEPKSERIKATAKDADSVSLIASFAGINLKTSSHGVTITNEFSGINIPLYKQEDGLLVSENDEIKMSYKDGKTTIINANQIFTFNGKCFAMGPVDNPEQIKIEKIEKNYQISYGGEVIKDPIKLGLIFKSIKKKYPVFYERTMKNSRFARMQAESEAKDKESTEIIQDEFGITHINPLCREKYIEKMHVLGFKVVENEKGVSLVNQDGNAFPVTSDGYTRVSNDKKSYVSTDLYITTKNKIKGPLINYSNPTFNLYCSTDYRTMNLYADNNHYFMQIHSDGTLEASIEQNGEYIPNTELVTQAFERYVPNLCEKVLEVYSQVVEEQKQKESKKKTEQMLSELENSRDISSQKTSDNKEQDT